MDIYQHKISNQSENSTFIETIDHAREEIKQLLIEQKISTAECLENKEIRDEMIRHIRKNSVLTLKEIGGIFGGISESRVSKILNKS